MFTIFKKQCTLRQVSRSGSPPKMVLIQLAKITVIVYNNNIVSSDIVVLCFVVQLEMAVERPLFFCAKKVKKVVDLCLE